MHFFTQINDEQLYQQLCIMVMATADQVKEKRRGEKDSIINENNHKYKH